jgi:hypothetical protein
MFPIQDRFLNKLKPLFRASGWFSFGAYLLLGLGIALLLGHSAYRAFAQPGSNLESYDLYLNPAITVTHIPPLIARTGDTVRLEFLFDCSYIVDIDLSCKPDATLYMAFGSGEKFIPIVLKGEDRSTLRTLVAEIPSSDANGQALQYFLELNDPSVKVHNRYPLYGAIELTVVPSFIEIDLPSSGTPVSGELMADAAWGNGPGEVGLSNEEGLAPVGPDAFDIASNGDIALLDEVNKRVLLFNLYTRETSSYAVDLKGWGDLAFISTGELMILDMVGESTSKYKATPQLYILNPISKRVQNLGPVFVRGAVDLTTESMIVDVNLGRVIRPIDSLGAIKPPEEQLKGYSQAQLLVRWQDDFRSLFADPQQGLVFDIRSVDTLGAIGHFSKINVGYVVVFEGKNLRILWLDNNGQILNDISVPNQAQNPFYPHGRFVVDEEKGSVYYLNTTSSGMEIQRVDMK